MIDFHGRALRWIDGNNYDPRSFVEPAAPVLPHDHHPVIADSAQARNDGRVVTGKPVTMQLAKIADDLADIIVKHWAPRMTGDKHRLPRFQGSVNAPRFLNPLGLQLGQLAGSVAFRAPVDGA